MQPSEHVIITLSGSSTNEFIVGKAEHKTGGTFFFRLEMDSAPGLSGVKGGLIRIMRIEQGGGRFTIFMPTERDDSTFRGLVLRT